MKRTCIITGLGLFLLLCGCSILLQPSDVVRCERMAPGFNQCFYSEYAGDRGPMSIRLNLDWLYSRRGTAEREQEFCHMLSGDLDLDRPDALVETYVLIGHVEQEGGGTYMAVMTAYCVDETGVEIQVPFRLSLAIDDSQVRFQSDGSHDFPSDRWIDRTECEEEGED